MTYFHCIENGQAVFNRKYVEPKPQFTAALICRRIEYTLTSLTEQFGDRVTSLRVSHSKPVQNTDELSM